MDMVVRRYAEAVFWCAFGVAILGGLLPEDLTTGVAGVVRAVLGTVALAALAVWVVASVRADRHVVDGWADAAVEWLPPIVAACALVVLTGLLLF